MLVKFKLVFIGSTQTAMEPCRRTAIWIAMAVAGPWWLKITSITHTQFGLDCYTQGVNFETFLVNQLALFDLWLGVIGEPSYRIPIRSRNTAGTPTVQGFAALIDRPAIPSIDGQVLVNSSNYKMNNHNGMGLSTYDNDNDSSGGNCANDYHSPWWYYHCWQSNIWGQFF